MSKQELSIQKILVASDLSDQAGVAIKRAIELGREHGSDVTIVHVVDEGLPQAEQSSLMTTSDHFIRQIVGSDPWAQQVKTSIEIVSGRPDIDIVERAELDEADLIVIGLHNRMLEENLTIQGTVAEQVMQATRIPVLIVKDAPRGPYRSALVGVDFSVFSRAAVIAARSIAPQANLHLVHAFEPISGMQHLAKIREPEIARRITKSWQSRLNKFIDYEMAELAGIGAKGAIDIVSSSGDPQEVLRSVAERVDAELIVMGSHGRTGLTRLILGSITTQILNDRLADVLVVRPF